VSNVSPSDGTTIALPRHSFKREVEDLDALIVEAGGTLGARICNRGKYLSVNRRSRAEELLDRWDWRHGSL
jgi:hypothetical protein